MIRVAVVAAVVAAAATAAIFVNLALLAHASTGDVQVGKLSRRAQLTPAPADVIRPHEGRVEHDDDDD